ncbi:serine hydrolase domain-containing protein [Lacipirellula sp.]|uniref:serine hydrolase domain-containing protein n=1 Tax=Lacipirellula sp. TaxID=2691419 RepID=UPI003D0F0F5F
MTSPLAKPLLSLTIFTALAAACMHPTFAQLPKSSPELIKKVEAALPDSPGASVLAIDDGQIVFRHSYGLADVENNVPCTPTTNFRMASVSKQFTATAILMLVDRELISLDDPLTKFFPGFPEYGEEITVRHLLTHTSGIPDYEGLVPKGTTLQLKDLDVLQLLMQTDIPLFEPGAKWQYSNSGYVLLGLIVERASKTPFEIFMKDDVFSPLKMTNSNVFQHGLNVVPERAYGHTKQDGKWVRADQSVTSATRGDGCVYTSVDEYAKWLRGHAERRLLSGKSHDSMFSPQVKTTRDGSSYSFGWFLDEYRGEERIHHNGDSRGFRLCSQVYPDRMAAVILQFNCDLEEPTIPIGERISDILIFDREAK